MYYFVRYYFVVEPNKRVNVNAVLFCSVRSVGYADGQRSLRVRDALWGPRIHGRSAEQLLRMRADVTGAPSSDARCQQR